MRWTMQDFLNKEIGNRVSPKVLVEKGILDSELGQI